MTLLALDSASLWFRAFHGVPDSVVAPDGQQVNAVRGFLDTVSRLVTEHRPTHLVAALDADWRPAWRVRLVPSYKAHRVLGDPTVPATDDKPLPGRSGTGAEDSPPGLDHQVDAILDIWKAAGLVAVGVTGMEADDVLGTYATIWAGPVDVVSGDRDLMQLVDDARGIRLLYAVEKMAPYDEAAVLAKHGVPPSLYADTAILRGDASDGLPGVKGIGAKTAADLVTRYGTVEKILAATVTPATAAAKVDAGREYLSRAVAVTRVVRDLDVPTAGLALPAAPADADALGALAERWGVVSSVQRLGTALQWF